MEEVQLNPGNIFCSLSDTSCTAVISTNDVYTLYVDGVKTNFTFNCEWFWVPSIKSKESEGSTFLREVYSTLHSMLVFNMHVVVGSSPTQGSSFSFEKKLSWLVLLCTCLAPLDSCTINSCLSLSFPQQCHFMPTFSFPVMKICLL